MKSGRLSLMLAAVLALSGCASPGSHPTPSPSLPGSSVAWPSGEEELDQLELKSLTDFEFFLTGEAFSISGDAAVPHIQDQYLVSAPGTYTLKGDLVGEQIVVKKGIGAVKLILDSVSIHGKTSAIFIKSQNRVTIEAKAGTKNYFDDGEKLAFEEEYAATGEDEPKGTIFSKSDLTFEGDGEIYIISEAKDIFYADPKTDTTSSEAVNGVQVKKSNLFMKGPKVFIRAASNGIKAKGRITFDGGEIEIRSSNDGVQSDYNPESLQGEETGVIDFQATSLAIEAGDDGWQSEIGARIRSGYLFIRAGDGPTPAASLGSCQGIKAESSDPSLKNFIEISGGDLNLETTGDSLHTPGKITFTGGATTIKSGADAVHADGDFIFDGDAAQLTILASLEAIEARTASIRAGFIYAKAEKDAVDCSKTSDRGQENSSVLIAGGTLVAAAGQASLSASGSILMSGGKVLVLAGAIKAAGSFKIAGGTLLAVGDREEFSSPSSASTQNVLTATFASEERESLFAVEDESGSLLFAFKMECLTSSLIFSSAQVKTGSTYRAFKGGAHRGGTRFFGLGSGGVYSGGEKIGSAVVRSSITPIVGE